MTRRRRISATQLLAGAAVLVAAIQIVRLTIELRRYWASLARLRTTWTVIPSVLGGHPLNVRALVSTQQAVSSPAIVLVHGYGIGSTYMVPLAAHLANHARVYAPDLPGHGPSEHEARPLTIPELARALAAWMDACQLSGALLVGHSLGCQVAAELAAHRPEMVSGLVLVGPTCDTEARDSTPQIARGLRGAVYERSTFAIWTALDYRRAGAQVLSHELRQMVEHRIEDALSAVKGPVRVVRGARDRIVPQAWAEKVARIAGAPTPTVIAHWGHAVHYDDPAAVGRVTLELAELVRSAWQSTSVPSLAPTPNGSGKSGATQQPESQPRKGTYLEEKRPEHYAG